MYENSNTHDNQESHSIYFYQSNKSNPLIHANSKDTIAAVNVINQYLRHSSDIIEAKTGISKDTYIAALHLITKCVTGAMNYELERLNRKVMNTK